MAAWRDPSYTIAGGEYRGASWRVRQVATLTDQLDHKRFAMLKVA